MNNFSSHLRGMSYELDAMYVEFMDDQPKVEKSAVAMRQAADRIDELEAKIARLEKEPKT